MAGAQGDPTAMVAAADSLKGKLHALGTGGTTVSLTGASGMWSDFNTANRTAMMKSELFSWPVTMIILVLAFGSLVAAGLPLMLTILGLVASAGLLALLTHGFEISIWAMNFALMFALALGIDYALFIVHRFRGAYFGSGLDARDAVAVTMDTAGQGRPVLGRHRPDLALGRDARAQPGIPLDGARDHDQRHLRAPGHADAAARRCSRSSDRRSTRSSLRWVHSGEHRSARFARWGALLWRRPHLFGPAATIVLVLLALPVLGLKTGMPSIKVVPSERLLARRLHAGAAGVRRRRPRSAPDRGPAGAGRSRDAGSPAHDPGIASVSPAAAEEAAVWRSCRPSPTPIRPAPPSGARSTGSARTFPRGRSWAEPPRRTTTSSSALSAKTPLVIGVVLALGFLLLLVALQAPLIAALGVLTNLLATGAAFGIARLIFQNGHGSGLLGFESQGFLDAWGPVFFFAMIFAISMDYTVFLLSSAKEHYDRTGDPREAMIGGLAHSGRVIFAAAAVMVAVFFTFALSGPLPPKEMGVILGIAVLLDAMLVRLVLIPTLLRIFGHYAWAKPRWLDRILPNVRFGHS